MEDNLNISANVRKPHLGNGRLPQYLVNGRQPKSIGKMKFPEWYLNLPLSLYTGQKTGTWDSYTGQQIRNLNLSGLFASVGVWFSGLLTREIERYIINILKGFKANISL
jgi:hypothetical protein